VPFDAIGASPHGSAIYRGREGSASHEKISYPNGYCTCAPIDPIAAFQVRHSARNRLFPTTPDALAGLDSKKRMRCRHETFIESNL